MGLCGAASQQDVGEALADGRCDHVHGHRGGGVHLGIVGGEKPGFVLVVSPAGLLGHPSSLLFSL